MTEKKPDKPGNGGISKVKLALGAASLFLFIIGVKRTFQMDQGDAPPEKPAGSKRDRRKP